jgi:hypothetical protein
VCSRIEIRSAHFALDALPKYQKSKKRFLARLRRIHDDEVNKTRGEQFFPRFFIL